MLWVAALFVSTAANAMSSEEREATFWRVAVVDFAGRTPGKVDGPTAGVRVAASLRNSKRFHVIDPRTVRNALRANKINTASGQLEESDAKKLCKELRVDGIFTGKIEGGALTLSLYSQTGKLFSRYRFNITPQFPLKEAAGVAKSYTQRLPYDGLVVSVRRDLALINLGTANGIGNGSKVYAFAFESMARDVDGAVKGGNRTALAELEVVRSEQHGAWVRPLKGEMPEQFSKISLRPVVGTTELKPIAKASESVGTPWLALEVGGDVGLLLKSYELEGTGARFTSSTTLFPAPGVTVQWFPTKLLGVGFSLRHGFVPFRRKEGTGPDRRLETYDGSTDNVLLEGKLRKVFSSGGFAGGDVALTGGAYYSRFTVEKQDPLVLTSDSYMGPILGVDAHLPLLDRVALRTKLGVVPFAIVSESPVDNGKGSAFGVVGKVGLDYHISDTMFMSFDYGADSFRTQFPSDGGSRNLQNPKSSDLYHGVTITVGYRSYR